MGVSEEIPGEDDTINEEIEEANTANLIQKVFQNIYQMEEKRIDRKVR